MKRKKPKKLTWVVTPLGKGRYHAIWQKGKILSEAVFTDKGKFERLKSMKNPYKHGLFPYVIVDFEENAPRDLIN